MSVIAILKVLKLDLLVLLILGHRSVDRQTHFRQIEGVGATQTTTQAQGDWTTSTGAHSTFSTTYLQATSLPNFLY